MNKATTVLRETLGIEPELLEKYYRDCCLYNDPAYIRPSQKSILDAVAALHTEYKNTNNGFIIFDYNVYSLEESVGDSVEFKYYNDPVSKRSITEIEYNKRIEFLHEDLQRFTKSAQTLKDELIACKAAEELNRGWFESLFPSWPKQSKSHEIEMNIRVTEGVLGRITKELEKFKKLTPEINHRHRVKVSWILDVYFY